MVEKEVQVNIKPRGELLHRLRTIQRIMGHDTLTQTARYLLGEATYRKLKELGFEVGPELDTDLDDDE